MATGEELTTGETLLYAGVTIHPDGETIVSAETDPHEGSTLLFPSPETLRITHEIS
ncbi:hypothetical protein [Nocardiopsis sp. YSL2]|uniref:hypothetical protein n=1 Tax=Nocardiopsis sp. YSL2 TaxID=2939492 RepID=UPI0026F4496E|nr:hypothetical protein [Nocardiopsis sp. YSL2]